MAAEYLGHTPRFTGRVSAEILDKSMQRNSNHCMLAEAVKQANPKLKYVSVDIQTIRATDLSKSERYVWLTPRRCQLAIIKFDQGKRPTPFKFELRDGQTVRAGKKHRKTKSKAVRRSNLRPPKKGAAGSVPVRVGGEVPPKSVGRRRSFGLRSLEF